MAEFIANMNMGVYLPLILLSLILQVIASRKILFAWFDPIAIYLFTNSFGIAFTIYLFIDKEINLEDLISFLLATCCFFVGMNLGNNKSLFKKNKVISIKKGTSVNSILKYSNHLYIFVFVSLIILLISTLLLVAIFGTLPLFSSDIDVAKVAARGPGLGIIYRINGALLPTSLAIIFSKLFHPITRLKKYENLILYAILLLLLFLLVSGGNKSGTLTVTSILSYLFLVNARFRSSNGDTIPKLIFIFLGLAIFFMLVIFAQAAVAGNYTSFYDGILVRFVAAGEPFYYFYKYNLILKMSSTPLDYLIDSLSPFFSLIKIGGEYKDALGSRLITEAIGLDVGKFGTNPQYQVEGAIYFGTIGSFFYSFLIGYTITWTRNYLLEKVIADPNQLNLVIYSLISSHILSIQTDSLMLYVTIYSIIIIALPIFLLISLILGTQLSKTEK
jgi:oligosaccharide repeat unit polymerase